MNGELPEGWILARISDVTERVVNVRPQDEPNREFVYVDISAIDNHRFTIAAPRRLSGSSAPSRAQRPIRPGDTLFSNVRTYLRNIALVPDSIPEGVCSTGFTVLRPNGAAEPGYLFRYVLSPDFIDRVTPQQTGTHYPAASDRKIFAETIALPPLSEQRRLISVLDGALDRTAECRERLSRLSEEIGRLRQVVLAAACSGRLTAGWRAALGVEDGDAPGRWLHVALGSLMKGTPQNGLYKPQSAYGSGTPIVRIDAFYDGAIRAWDELDRLRLSDDERRQFLLEGGDILVNRVNSMKFLGKCALIGRSPESCVFESNMMRFRLDTTRALPEFVVLYLRSPRGLAELRKNAKHAVNQSSINQKDVSDCLCPLPPLDEQREITRRATELFQHLDRTEGNLRAANESVDNLAPSLLAKAFRGELVPTEAELAAAEGRAYETATELLERIRRGVESPDHSAGKKAPKSAKQRKHRPR